MAKLKPLKSSKKNSLKVVNQKKDSKIDIEEAIERLDTKEPLELSAPDSMSPMQLKVPSRVKHEYKAYAALRGEKMNDMFLKMFAYYKEHHD